MTRRIVCAAVKIDFFPPVILLGVRHWDDHIRTQLNAMRVLHDTDFFGLSNEEGFIDNQGVFLTREDAMRVALKSCQPFDLARNGGDELELRSTGIY